jgi:hypothetical protein
MSYRRQTKNQFKKFKYLEALDTVHSGSELEKEKLINSSRKVPEEILLALALDEDAGIPSRLAYQSPYLPISVARLLARDPRCVVRNWLSRRLVALSPKIAEILAKDPECAVRRNIAARSETPREILLMLAVKDEDAGVRDAALKKLCAKSYPAILASPR